MQLNCTKNEKQLLLILRYVDFIAFAKQDSFNQRRILRSILFSHGFEYVLLLGNRIHASVTPMSFEPVNADPSGLLATIMVADDTSATRTTTSSAEDLSVQRMVALLYVYPSIHLLPVDLSHSLYLIP